MESKKETISYPRIVYFNECEECGKEIKGLSPDALKHNMRVHIKAKHEEGGEEDATNSK